MSLEKDTRPPAEVKFSLRSKLILGFTLVFAIPFALAYYWFWQYSLTTARARIHDDLDATLRGTLRGINGDDFQNMVKDAQVDETGAPARDPLYIQHQAWLLQVYWIQPRAYNAYTYVSGSRPNTVRWIGDNYRDIRPLDASAYLDSYTPGADSLIMQGFIANTINMTPYKDPWGQHVSAYGPIKNSSGQVVGAVGIDFQAGELRKIESDINRTMAISGALAFLILFLVIYVTANYLTKPMIRLTEATQRVSEGDYNQDFSSLSRGAQDEISVLAANFAHMVDKVYHREQNLRRQVEELKIEIDDAKRSRQVNEIVDTDFFRDLQAKADRMRMRRNTASSGPTEA